MKLPPALALGVLFLAGCARESSTPETSKIAIQPRFILVDSNPDEAFDTHTGKLCLTYAFTEEDEKIASLRGKSEQEQKAFLSSMDESTKKRVLDRLTMPKTLPVCSDLSKS